MPEQRLTEEVLGELEARGNVMLRERWYSLIVPTEQLLALIAGYRKHLCPPAEGEPKKTNHVACPACGREFGYWDARMSKFACPWHDCLHTWSASPPPAPQEKCEQCGNQRSEHPGFHHEFLAAKSPSPQGIGRLPFDRETLGRKVREVWIRWAKKQPEPKPHWLIPWEECDEGTREVDRMIGEEIALMTKLGLDARESVEAEDEVEAEIARAFTASRQPGERYVCQVAPPPAPQGVERPDGPFDEKWLVETCKFRWEPQCEMYVDAGNDWLAYDPEKRLMYVHDREAPSIKTRGDVLRLMEVLGYPLPPGGWTRAVPGGEVERLRLGEVLRVARVQCGWGLRQFAEKVGILPSRYCDCEHGRETLAPDEWTAISAVYQKSEPWGIDCPMRDAFLELEAKAAALERERDDLDLIRIQAREIVGEADEATQIHATTVNALRGLLWRATVHAKYRRDSQ